MNLNLMTGSVFLAGILSFFSPCILPLLPVYVGMLTNDPKADSEETTPTKGTRLRRNIIKTLLFIAGLGTIFITLGYGAGSLGSVFTSQWFTIFAGVLVILFGLNQLGVLRFNFMRNWSGVNVVTAGKNQYWGAFLLGLLISFGWTPCIGPVLTSVLLLAGSSGTAIKAALYMAIYTLGMAIPFLVIVLFSDVLLGKIKQVNRWMPVLKKVGGGLLVIAGILMITNRLTI